MTPRALSLFALSLLFAGSAGAGCKSKDCEPLIAQSGDVQSALGEFDLTKAKAGADAIAKDFAGRDPGEIANLVRSAEALSRAIGPMQDKDVSVEDREEIRSDFDLASQNFASARNDVRRVCE